MCIRDSIEASSGLSDAEIEQMRKAARENEATDKQRREQAETRNSADQLVFSSEKNLKDYGDKLPAEKRAKIEASLHAALSWSVALLSSATSVPLSASLVRSSEASEDLYKAMNTQGADGATADGQPTADADGTGPVTDADFEVVDEGDAR